MTYAIYVLEKEKELIDKCLKGFNQDQYKEAFKRQERKSIELSKAIIKLINQNN